MAFTKRVEELEIKRDCSHFDTEMGTPICLQRARTTITSCDGCPLYVPSVSEIDLLAASVAVEGIRGGDSISDAMALFHFIRSHLGK